MTAILDYGVFPPELNSARMYAGPGSGSLLSAASAWDGLAADLHSQAANFGSVVEGLTSGGWQGPASASMAAAAAPYVAWMNNTAAQAEQTAAQVKSAAAAYEAAFSATVPPPVIAANRAQLTSLVATNVIGQNTPAIMANEAYYAEMWAQDAGAMYGYAGQSSAATQLTTFTPPAQTTNSAGLASQSAAAGALQGVASTGSTSSSTATSTATSGSSWLSSLLNSLTGDGTDTGLGNNSNAVLGVDSNFWNTVTSTGAFNPTQIVQAITGSTFLGAGVNAVQEMTPSGLAAGLGLPAGSGISGLLGLGGPGNGIAAGLGKAATLGPVSVPPAWTSIATPNSPLGSALGATPLNAPASAVPVMPGMPIPSGAAASNTAAAAAPKYGFRPTMIMQSPMAG